MDKELYREIKSWPFAKRVRQLTINQDIIKYSLSSFLGNTFTVFAKNEIEEFRYGIRWLRGFEFVIGREYQIFVRNQNKDEIAIYFKTMYGFRRKQLHQQYNDILQTLWNMFFIDKVNFYVKKFQSDEEFELGNVYFAKHGLTISVSHTFSKKEKKFIEWDKVGTHTYATYFALYSLDDPSNINHGYSYYEDWNTYVLKTVMESILDYKKAKKN